MIPPQKFQFRVRTKPGFTHTARLIDNTVEVKWARGWSNETMCVPDLYYNKWYFMANVQNGEWVVVQEALKQERAGVELPDEFYFTVVGGEMPYYKAALDGGQYIATWEGAEGGTPYSISNVRKFISEASWKILDKKPLAPEQERFLREYKEQLAALDSSIKLNEQDICHKERLIAAYKERQEVLRGKISEIEGLKSF